MAVKVTAELDPKDLKALSKDIDDLLVSIGQELASVTRMKPMVTKVRQGMAENDMGFKNSEVWHNTKHSAALYGIVDFDNPLMTTGQLVKDFIFQSEKIRKTQFLNTNEYIIGGFTWADKERKRPTYKHVLNQLARKEGGIDIYPDAEKFSFLKSSELVKIIMRSPRYPIMDSIVSLYKADVQLHMERLINEAFAKKK